MTDAERLFLDTNVLLAATDRSRSRHADSISLIEASVQRSVRLFLSGQVLREYLVVATRPVAQNGLGLDPQEANRNLGTFLQVAQLLPENADTARILRELVVHHALSGKRIHDAGIVATMLSHGLRDLKTWNPDEFSPFAELRLL
ncbi:MAG: type II toxin-antitoxin system VapC family toxin [Opitutales bacterium]